MILARLVLFIIIFAAGLAIAPILGWVEMFKQAKYLWQATGKKRETPVAKVPPNVNFQYPPGYSGVETQPKPAEQPKSEGKTTMSADDWAKVSLVHWDREGHS